MNKITVDYSHVLSHITEKDLFSLHKEVAHAHALLHEGTGAGAAFTGWLQRPVQYDRAELDEIQAAAEKIRRTSSVLVVIGIGGSYLGAKAAIEMLADSIHPPKTEILFAGNSISSDALKKLLDYVRTRDFSINVISKSGTTMEPAIAFRFFKALLEEKYGKAAARDRIYVTTDKCLGALQYLAESEGYESFVIPRDIGGRYSVLTAVGLLPIAVCGADVHAILSGAREAYYDLLDANMERNECYKYAACRNALYRCGKQIEILASFEPSLFYFSEWWKQLYGESEGKDHKGIFPVSASFSADLHSLGQYIQDGHRILFETVLNIKNPSTDIVIPSDSVDADNLNYLAGKSVSHVNQKALLGTVLAHSDGGVPTMVLNIPAISEYYFGYMVFFFEKACAISGYTLGVNPFDQPGVEAYKRNMFALLGKPGYEKEQMVLQKIGL